VPPVTPKFEEHMNRRGFLKGLAALIPAAALSKLVLDKPSDNVKIKTKYKLAGRGVRGSDTLTGHEERYVLKRWEDLLDKEVRKETILFGEQNA